LLLEQTTFFVDRSLGRNLGIVLRAAGWKIELHGDHFKDDTPDEDWLLQVGAKGWVVLTKDKNIRHNEVERRAVVVANIRMFTLPSGNWKGQEMVDAYLNGRPKMGRVLKKQPAPFVAVVYKDGSRVEVVLPKPKEPAE
jgi:hypothetical protein